MLRMFGIDFDRHLMRSECAFVLQAINEFWPCPALGRAQHNHRPARPGCVLVIARSLLNFVNFTDRFLHRGCHQLMHCLRLIAFDKIRRPAAALEILLQFLRLDTGEECGIGDLVAIEVQDRQNRAVGFGIEKLVGVPGGCQRPGLRLAIADNTGDNQIGIVEHGAKGMAQRISQLAAFVDRAGRRGRHMA